MCIRDRTGIPLCCKIRLFDQGSGVEKVGQGQIVADHSVFQLAEHALVAGVALGEEIDLRKGSIDSPLRHIFQKDFPGGRQRFDLTQIGGDAGDGFAAVFHPADFLLQVFILLMEKTGQFVQGGSPELCADLILSLIHI